MGFASSYLKKNAGTFSFQPDLNIPPSSMVVVIPCLNEPDLWNTLQSLSRCLKPNGNVIVLVCINDAENSSSEIKAQNKQTQSELDKGKVELPLWLHLRWIYAKNVPAKHAGAGWARKIGMDWTVSFYNHHNKPDGLIISLDADSVVDINYFIAIENYFENNSSVAATLYFEHPIGNGPTSEAIVLYELYMRYYKNALEYIGFPHSIYTIGSCFVVKAMAYVSQGGMNRRKAGEDFYFLHKLMPLGKVGQINSTTVYPSARVSNRVPFGTGPVLQKYLEGNRELQQTYPLESFKVLQSFFKNSENIYRKKQKLSPVDLSDSVSFQFFCNSTNLTEELDALKSNCSSLKVFEKRFFHLFNAFRILKWLNYALGKDYVKNDLIDEATTLLSIVQPTRQNHTKDPKILLNFYRSIEKAQRFR